MVVKTFLLSVTDDVDCCDAVVMGTLSAAVEDEEVVNEGIPSVGSNAFEQSAMYRINEKGSYTHIQYINFKCA